MRLRWLLIVGALALASSAQAQTNTATSTPTQTPTQTLGRKATPGSTDFGAFQHGSFRADPACSGGAFEQIVVTIPGLKKGDLIVVYPQPDFQGIINWLILANNKLALNASCATDSASHDWEYVWFSRTQDNCAGPNNCKAASTVTPTP